MNSNAWRFTWPDWENAVVFHPCVERQKAFNWKGRNILPSRAIDRLVLVPLTLTNMVSATHYEFTGIHIFKNVD